MITSVCQQQLPISSVLLRRRDLLHLEISSQEWCILEDIVELLQPFKIATQHLSGEKYPTISAVGPLLSEIKKRIAIDSSDSTAVKEFKRALGDDVNSRYQHPDIKMLFNKSSFLDPRFKSLTHLSTLQKEEVHEVVLQEAIELASKTRNSELPTVIEPENDDASTDLEPKQKKKKNALVDMLGDSFNEDCQTNSSTVEDVMKSEVLRYKSEGTISLDLNPLEWWSGRECVFPNLCKLAVKYMCITATSVPSEQLFSAAGNIVSSKRASLSPENVDKLVFLHSNLPPVEVDYKRLHTDH